MALDFSLLIKLEANVPLISYMLGFRIFLELLNDDAFFLREIANM